MEELLIGLAVVVAYSFGSIRILKQYERGVAFFSLQFSADATSTPAQPDPPPPADAAPLVPDT